MTINELTTLYWKIERLSNDKRDFHESKSDILGYLGRKIAALRADALGMDVKSGVRQGGIRSMTF